MKSETARAVLYWLTTALLAFELGLGGMWDVLRLPDVRLLMGRLGYPVYLSLRIAC